MKLTLRSRREENKISWKTYASRLEGLLKLRPCDLENANTCAAVAHLKVKTLQAHFNGGFLNIFEVFWCEAGFSSWCVRTIIWFFVYLIEIDQFWHFMKKAGNIQYLGTIFRIWQHCPIRSKNNKQKFNQNLRIVECLSDFTQGCQQKNWTPS